MKTKQAKQTKTTHLSAETNLNHSKTFTLSSLQRSILKGLSKCDPGIGIMLDKRFKRNAESLAKLRFIECGLSDKGQNVYLITETGRRALKKAEAVEKNRLKGINNNAD